MSVAEQTRGLKLRLHFKRVGTAGKLVLGAWR